MISISANRVKDVGVVGSGIISLHPFSEMVYGVIYSEGSFKVCARIGNISILNSDRMELKMDTDENGSYIISAFCQYDFAQFVDAIETCRSITSLTFDLNNTVRDIFLDGVYSKCSESISSFRDLGSYLTTCATSLASAIESKRYVSYATLVEGSENVKLNFSETVCVYCDKRDVGMEAFSMKVHPYVPVDFDKRVLYFCQHCHRQYMAFRKQAVDLKMLVLPGEYNEELCACCADSPTKLVLCAKCPRSFCDPCLQRLLTTKAYTAMKSEDNWLCMCCVPSEAQFRAIASTLSLPLPLLGPLSSMDAPHATWSTSEPRDDIGSAEDDMSEPNIEEDANDEVQQYSQPVKEPTGANVVQQPGKKKRGRKPGGVLHSQRKKSEAQPVGGHGTAEPIAARALRKKRPAQDASIEIDYDEAAPSQRTRGARKQDQTDSSSMSSISLSVYPDNSEAATSGRRSSGRRREVSMKMMDFEDTDVYIDSLSRRRAGRNSKIVKDDITNAKQSKQKHVAARQQQQPRERKKEVDTDIPPLSTVHSRDPGHSLPPVDATHDEVYYFAQYIDYLLPIQGIAPEDLDTEDFCFLCKDGGDLVECDNLRHKGPHKHCKKVYHEYCLCFEVTEDSTWKCFRHYCGVCGNADSSTHKCKLCPNAFCPECLPQWSRSHNHHSYILSQGTFSQSQMGRRSDKIGDEDEELAATETPAKNRRGRRKQRPVVDIICGNCIRMIGRCRERGIWDENIVLGPVIEISESLSSSVMSTLNEISSGPESVDVIVIDDSPEDKIPSPESEDTEQSNFDVKSLLLVDDENLQFSLQQRESFAPQSPETEVCPFTGDVAEEVLEKSELLVLTGLDKVGTTQPCGMISVVEDAVVGSCSESPKVPDGSHLVYTQSST